MRSLFPIIFILIAGTLFFVLVRPLYSETSKLSADIDVYNTALDNSKDLQTTRDALLVNYQNITAEDKNRLMEFLPNSVNNIGLILQIEKIAKEHNMELADITFDAEKPGTTTKGSSVAIKANDPNANRTFGVFPFEFTTEGTYEDFVGFLTDVERNLRLVDVKSISFSVPTQSAKAQEQNTNIYSYSLKVETYWLK